MLLIPWSTYWFVKIHAPEPHLQRSGAAVWNGAWELPFQSAPWFCWPAVMLYPKRALTTHTWPSGTQKSVSETSGVSSDTFLQHHMERLCGMTCCWNGHPWVPGVLNTGTTDPKGVHREIDRTCNPMYLFFFFLALGSIFLSRMPASFTNCQRSSDTKIVKNLFCSPQWMR